MRPDEPSPGSSSGSSKSASRSTATTPHRVQQQQQQQRHASSPSIQPMLQHHCPQHPPGQQHACTGTSQLLRAPRPPRRALLPALLLVGALCAAVLPGARAADAFDRSLCPAWLDEYEAFHTANRGAPGAKYLIAEAPGFVGVGDHLRGMMYALRVAAATRRVLLLHWENPGNLTDFLVPSGPINWTFEGTAAEGLGTASLKQPTQGMEVLTGADLGRLFPDDAFFDADPAPNKTLLVLRTNHPADQRCLACGPMEGKPARSYDYVCLFRALFRPSPAVEAATDKTLAALYPGAASLAGLEYVVVHLRLGQLRGESDTISRLSRCADPLFRFLRSVSCGVGLAGQAGINTSATPVLLLADHRGVRQFAQHGRLARVVTPPHEAVHTKLNSVADHLLSFVDLNLMARAKCLVTSHSGFSNVGWWMGGGNSCRMMLGECHNACAADPTGPFCN